MADIIVQPKVKNADGSFDTIIINRVLNSETSEKATYATYASADTSKGTIEERLTKLGYLAYKEEGSINFGVSYFINKVVRQGNYVIGQFSSDIIKSYSGPSSETGYLVLSGNISSSRLYPKEPVVVPVSIQFGAGGIGDVGVQSQTYAVIETDGSVKVYLRVVGAEVDYVYIRNYDETQTILLNFGYEAKAL